MRRRQASLPAAGQFRNSRSVQACHDKSCHLISVCITCVAMWKPQASTSRFQEAKSRHWPRMRFPRTILFTNRSTRTTLSSSRFCFAVTTTGLLVCNCLSTAGLTERAFFCADPGNMLALAIMHTNKSGCPSPIVVRTLLSTSRHARPGTMPESGRSLKSWRTRPVVPA